MAKQWIYTNDGRLNRVKLIGQRCGWEVIFVTDAEIGMRKDEDQNRYVDIHGTIEYKYNCVEHSVTTKLKHNGKIKTLKRWIQKDKWKPVEDVLKYPRAHLGQNIKKFKYLKNDG